MSVERILTLVALALAVIGAFATIPMVGAAFAMLGLAVGNYIAKEDHVRVLVTALVLAGGENALDAIPAVGPHLTHIIANVGSIAAAAAITATGGCAAGGLSKPTR